jgi:Na+/proline symporter
MTNFSAWTFTGAAGVAFESGWSVAIIFLANATGFLINAVFIAPWFRQLRAITGPEVIRMRFGEGTRQFYAWVGVLASLLYASLGLCALGIFASAVFGFDLSLVIIVVGIVVVLYSTTGGSWAVMATDFLQGLILLPMTVLVAVLCLWKIGGVGAMLDAIADGGLSSDYAVINEPGRFGMQFTWVWAAAMFLKTCIGKNTLAGAQRYFAVKDGTEARKAAMVGCVLMLLGMTVWFIPPIVARLLYAEQVMGSGIPKAAESAYAVASLQVLPAGLIGLMVVAMLAASMSNIDSGLNRNAAILVRDIVPLGLRAWRRVRGGEASAGNPDQPYTGEVGPRLGLWLGRGLSLVLGGAIIYLALLFAGSEGDTGIFEHMLTVGAVVAVPMSVPMFLALFIRKAPRWSAIVAVAAAAVPSAIGFVNGWYFHDQVFVNAATGAAAFFLTMPAWRLASPAYREQVAGFFTRMHTPVDFEREVGQANDPAQLQIVGLFAAAAAGFIALLVVLPNPLSGRLSILAVAAIVGGAGGFMVWTGRRMRTRAADASAGSPGDAN